MMPVSYAISRDDSHVLARYHGTVTLAQITAMYAAYQQDTAFRPERPHLVDLSRITDTDAGFAETFALFAIFARSYAAAGVQMRVAIYAPSDLTFGLSRIFQNLSESSDDIDTAIFDNLDQARTRVRCPDPDRATSPQDTA